MSHKNFHLSFIFFLLSLISFEIGDYSLCSEQHLNQDFEVETEIGRPQRVVKNIQAKAPVKIKNVTQVEFDLTDYSGIYNTLTVPQPTLSYISSGAKLAKEQTTYAS